MSISSSLSEILTNEPQARFFSNRGDHTSVLPGGLLEDPPKTWDHQLDHSFAQTNVMTMGQEQPLSPAQYGNVQPPIHCRLLSLLLTLLLCQLPPYPTKAWHFNSSRVVQCKQYNDQDGIYTLSPWNPSPVSQHKMEIIRADNLPNMLLFIQKERADLTHQTSVSGSVVWAHPLFPYQLQTQLLTKSELSADSPCSTLDIPATNKQTNKRFIILSSSWWTTHV